MDTIRVCQVANSVGPTSVPRDIAVAMNRYTDVEATIAGWFTAERFEEDDSITVYDIDAPNTTLGIDRQAVRDTRQILDEHDIVQVHSPHSGTFVKLLAHRMGVPVVSTEQNNHDGFTRKGLIANGLTNPLADCVTCVSEPVKESLRWWEKLFLDDVRVIYNGVQHERLSDTECEEFTLLDDIDVGDESMVVATAAALSEQKAYDVLIPAIDEANSRYAGTIELVAVGEGPLRNELETLAADLGVSDAIHLVGEVPRRDVYCLMAAADIYAMPSRWEGFSVAAIEAIAAGSACVFSDIPEFTEAYKEAALFHQVDDVGGLAIALARLARHDDLRKELSETATEIAPRFFLERIVSEYASLYRELLEQADTASNCSP